MNMQAAHAYKANRASSEKDVIVSEPRTLKAERGERASAFSFSAATEMHFSFEASAISCVDAAQ
jgi:hypothetical protein